MFFIIYFTYKLFASLRSKGLLSLIISKPPMGNAITRLFANLSNATKGYISAQTRQTLVLRL